MSNMLHKLNKYLLDYAIIIKIIAYYQLVVFSFTCQCVMYSSSMQESIKKENFEYISTAQKVFSTFDLVENNSLPWIGHKFQERQSRCLLFRNDIFQSVSLFFGQWREMFFLLFLYFEIKY